MPNTFATFQRFPRDIRLYIWAWGLVAFGYFGVFGVLFNLYLLRLGYGPETIGVLVGAGQLVWGLAALPAGMMGARIGNRDADHGFLYQLACGVDWLYWHLANYLYCRHCPQSV